MIYCISDIHGCYAEFMELLRKINFGPDDTLYVLGDVIDRGKASIKCLEHIMDTPNIHMLMGNHEQMKHGYSWLKSPPSGMVETIEYCKGTE